MFPPAKTMVPQGGTRGSYHLQKVIYYVVVPIVIIIIIWDFHPLLSVFDASGKSGALFFLSARWVVLPTVIGNPALLGHLERKRKSSRGVGAACPHLLTQFARHILPSADGPGNLRESDWRERGSFCRNA